jgi:hypothetical protein
VFEAMTEEEQKTLIDEMEANVAPIMNSDTCNRNNLVDLDQNDVNKLIQSHCVRSLKYGGRTKIEFDLRGLEEDIRDNYVLGKGEVRAMLPKFEFAGAAKIESIFDSVNIEFQLLDLDFLAEVTAYQSGIERTRAVELVEEVIVLTGRLGVEGDQPIYQFCRDVLSMDKSDWELFNLKNMGNEIQLKHLKHIWEYLKKQEVYEDPKRRGAPDTVLEIYREAGTEELHAQLDEFLNNISKGELEPLVTAWYDLLGLIGEETYNTTSYWKDWFSLVLYRKQG